MLGILNSVDAEIVFKKLAFNKRVDLSAEAERLNHGVHAASILAFHHLRFDCSSFNFIILLHINLMAPSSLNSHKSNG